MNPELKDKLVKRKEEGTLRFLSDFDGLIDFCSNDYLGLSRESIYFNETSYGGTGSRLISGTSKEAILAERELACFFNAQSALLFNSGYDANLGLFSSVPQRGDTVLYDALIHASIRDGIRLGFASGKSFAHNDLHDLENKLSETQGVIYVVVEGLYSMDGDFSPLLQITEICEKHGAYLIVDEAHSAGLFGDSGEGLVTALGLDNKIFARLVTFGKAYGSHGACVLGSSELIIYLLNFARSFIYTTALPPKSYVRNSKIITFESLEERRAQLQENLNLFRSGFLHTGLISELNSPIQILELGDIAATKSCAADLQKNGIAVKPIYAPTVPKGKERIRLCFHSFNTEKEINQLIQYMPIE
jgi:8-amino-7-oxononanoate synthase